MSTNRPLWTALHTAAEHLFDSLTRLSRALKAKNRVRVKKVYAELPGAIESLRTVAYPMEQSLRENSSTISDEEKTAGAYLARVINGAQDASVALSGFGNKGPDALNQWCANLQEVVRRSADLATKEVESN